MATSKVAKSFSSIPGPSVFTRTSAPGTPPPFTTIAALGADYQYALSTTDITSSIVGYMKNTGTSAGSGHAIGVLGFTEDTTSGQKYLYGVEGKVKGYGGVALQFYTGTLGQGIYIGSSRNALSFVAGCFADAQNWVTEGVTPYTGSGISVCYYASSITGGTDAFNYSFWGSNQLRNDHDIIMMRSGAQGYIYSYDTAQTDYTRMYHDGSNGYIETNVGNIFLKPTSGSNVLINNGTLAPLVGGSQALGTSSFEWLSLAIKGANDATAASIQINATSANVTASDTFISFSSTDGVIGSIAGTAVSGVIAYNTFTGSHYTQIDDMSNIKTLSLLEVVDEYVDFKDTEQDVNNPITGEVNKVTNKTNSGEQLFKSRLCSTKKSKKAIGCYGGTTLNGQGLILSIGTGLIEVANKGKNIEVGDFVMSSDEPGLAELQEDDLYHNYTVAKITEDIIWKQNEKSRKVSCIYLGG